MKSSKELKAVEEFKNEKSMILFNKNVCDLSIEESLKLDKYIYDLANPVWKPICINDKITNYEVSNIGNIRNIKTGRIRKGSPDKQGYIRFSLYIHNKHYPKKVHRLVAEAFIPNPENKPQVNHINGKKDCNWVGNLEWMTCKENVQHSYETGLVVNHASGERVGTSKYKESQIREVCKLLEDPIKRYEDIAKETGVSYDVIAKIGTKDLWTDVSKDYNIPNRIRTSSKYSTEYIENVCKMLANNVRPVEIQRIAKIPWSTLSMIKNRKSYTSISNKYAF